MSKLINTPQECGLRHCVKTRLGFDSGIRVCGHSSKVPGSTGCETSMAQPFPNHCPLEEGLPKKSIHWP